MARARGTRREGVDGGDGQTQGTRRAAKAKDPPNVHAGAVERGVAGGEGGGGGREERVAIRLAWRPRSRRTSKGVGGVAHGERGEGSPPCLFAKMGQTGLGRRGVSGNAGCG